MLSGVFLLRVGGTDFFTYVGPCSLIVLLVHRDAVALYSSS